VGFLVGDAADSPIVKEKVQSKTMLMLGYRFWPRPVQASCSKPEGSPTLRPWTSGSQTRIAQGMN